MRKYAFVALAAIAAALLLLSPSAEASGPRIYLTVNHQVVYAGQSFTATARATVTCALDVTWNDEVRHGPQSKTFAASYVAPAVTRVTKMPLTSACQVGESSGESARAADSLRRTVTVTVLPRSSDAAGASTDGAADLPGPGGPNRVFLLSGLVLVLAGASAVTLARRRAEEVELPGRTA